MRANLAGSRSRETVATGSQTPWQLTRRSSGSAGDVEAAPSVEEQMVVVDVDDGEARAGGGERR